MAEQRDIKYINREFSDFRTQLVEYAKQYFPDSYNDFSATAPGMMFIEMASYVGDVLSFYQDTQLQETFLQHAQNPQNLYTMAYMMGYRPKVTTASEVELEVTQEVDPITGGDTPDFDQALFISGGAVVGATDTNDTKFIMSYSLTGLISQLCFSSHETCVGCGIKLDTPKTAKLLTNTPKNNPLINI